MVEKKLLRFFKMDWYAQSCIGKFTNIIKKSNFGKMIDNNA